MSELKSNKNISFEVSEASPRRSMLPITISLLEGTNQIGFDKPPSIGKTSMTKTNSLNKPPAIEKLGMKK
jgi:hypothetical protein